MSLETVDVVRKVEILNSTDKTILLLTALFTRSLFIYQHSILRHCLSS